MFATFPQASSKELNALSNSSFASRILPPAEIIEALTIWDRIFAYGSFEAFFWFFSV